MPNPPEIDKPFASSDERRAANADFIWLGELVQQVISAPQDAMPAWLAAELAKPMRGINESKQIRLERYRLVFAEELAALWDAVTSERQRGLDDASLRAALYLAQRLLASLLDCPIGELRERLPST
jgi:hypothetical protein